MLLSPDKATKVVLAVIHLHNFFRKRSCQKYTPHGSLDTETETGITPGSWGNDGEHSSLLPLTKLRRRSGNDAKEIRLHLAQHFATNELLTCVAPNVSFDELFPLSCIVSIVKFYTCLA